MEGDYVNGTVEEQAAPQTLQELQAAGVHAMPVVAGFQEALAAQAAQLQAAAGTPAGMTGDDSTPGMHMGGSMSGRGRMSSGSFKNRSGPSYCQVEQCGEPLEGLKEYHQRYKVCEEHLKIPYIIRDGQQVRFCQQCGRFQPLEDFDDAKRSCRVRLQRHNARRRKKGPREGNSGGGMDHHHHMGDYGSMGGAAAEMAKLAYPQAAMVSGKDIQAMQEALHFASTTLMHSSQVVTGKPAGEEGGEEGEGGGGVAMGPNSMPFVPQPDVMMLLLKGYAAMFHYALDSATLRGLAQPSDLPDQQAAAAAGGGMGLGAVDALQMQHLMQAQGFFAGAGMPMLLPSGEAVEGMLPEEGQEAGGEGQQQQEQQPGGAEEEQQQQLQEHGAGEQQQQEHAAAVAAAHAAAGGGELTAEQVAAALIQPMPQDAAAAEGAMAAAAALASAAGAHVTSSAGYGEAGGEQEDHAEAMQQ